MRVCTFVDKQNKSAKVIRLSVCLLLFGGGKIWGLGVPVAWPKKRESSSPPPILFIFYREEMRCGASQPDKSGLQIKVQKKV